jgi:hypothetical protein
VTREWLLKRIFKENPGLWNHDGVKPEVRIAIRRWLDCGTGRLGKAFYRSPSGEKLTVPYTCKSPACASCAQRVILDWFLGVLSELPDIPYAGVLFTMHEDLWEIFRENRQLLRGLPAIAANALQDWADREHGARVLILAITHTFASRLNFNSHVHLIVSSIGLDRSGNGQLCDVHWNFKYVQNALMREWRHALIDYLRTALDLGLISSDKSESELREMLADHRDRWYMVGVRNVKSRTALLKYISRYLRRLPIAEYKILSYDGERVSFWYIDTKTEKKVIQDYSVKEFIELLIEQVPDRYRHGVHYFGLLAPRAKPAYEVFLACLGKRWRKRPRRTCWRKLIWIRYKRDSLRASNGEIMQKIGWWVPGMPEDGGG